MKKRVRLGTTLLMLALVFGISEAEERSIAQPASPAPIVSATTVKTAEAKPEPVSRDVEAMVRAISEGVGIASRVTNGAKGAPILLLEEAHVSRAGQIQHAIALVRLYDRFGLRNIALEGYLKERAEIKTDWFVNAARGMNLSDRNRVAVQLLQEGEINCAEFVKLIYDDAILHPIETAPEYAVEIDDEAHLAPSLYLVKIAMQTLRPEQILKLEQLMDEFARFEKSGDKQAAKKKNSEAFNYVISTDDWVQSKYRPFQDKDTFYSMSSEQHLALTKEIIDRTAALSVKLEPREQSAMDRYLAFWKGRTAASRTMALSAGEIADRAGVPIVAVVVGAGHTEQMSALLRDAGRPFAVVTPLSLKNHEENGDLTWEMLLRKYAKSSVFSRGYIQTLLNAFLPPVNKKPEPVLSEPWLQAKVELYTFVERIVGGVLAPPTPPSNGNAPWGFADDAFKGQWVFIDPRRIVIVSDILDGKGRAVLFPAILNPHHPTRRTEVWVKAGRVLAREIAPERESVESMLMHALQQVQSEKQASDKAEDESGRIRISLNTAAAFSTNQQRTLAVVLDAR